MQTFLPFEDFTECAKVLDYRRLGKQRIESCQILNTLAGNSKGWINHPAVKMWRGYENVLINYNLAICKEWVVKGYKDTMTDKTQLFCGKFNSLDYPKWLGDNNLHNAYKGILFHKNPVHYAMFSDYSKYDKLCWPV